jgi:hypothetical protein
MAATIIDLRRMNRISGSAKLIVMGAARRYALRYRASRRPDVYIEPPSEDVDRSALLAQTTALCDAL